MKTVEDFQVYYEEYGLLKTINRFNDFVHNEYGVLAGYTFDHIALGDFNLSDGNIDFCLEPTRILDWLLDQFPYEERKDRQTFNDYHVLDVRDKTEATQLIVSFLKWLKTIPIEVRDYLDGYYE